MTRSQVVDGSAAELRRIERDLHDGAQARLVSAGMSIGLAERAVRDDPELALSLLAEARASNGQALSDLRALVRGIHPPVLAERGLDGAIQALALALPLPVEVHISLPGRAPAPADDREGSLGGQERRHGRCGRGVEPGGEEGAQVLTADLFRLGDEVGGGGVAEAVLDGIGTQDAEEDGVPTRKRRACRVIAPRL